MDGYLGCSKRTQTAKQKFQKFKGLECLAVCWTYIGTISKVEQSEICKHAENSEIQRA